MNTVQVLVLDGDLPDLNSYINAERSNKYAAAQIKQDATYYVALEAKRQLKVIKSYPVWFSFEYSMKNMRKDKDNIDFTKKFIFDGLVMAGIMRNDGWKEIANWDVSFVVGYPRTTVTLREGQVI
jgi:hypothetical protein